MPQAQLAHAARHVAIEPSAVFPAAFSFLVPEARIPRTSAHLLRARARARTRAHVRAQMSARV